MNTTTTPVPAATRPGRHVGARRPWTRRTGRAGRTRWTRFAPIGAVAWSIGYAAVAIGWVLTGTGFPMGANDPGASMSLLGGVPVDVGPVVFATVAVAAAVVAAGMLAGAGARRRWWGIGFGAALSVVLLFVVPDVRVLTLVGYLPMIIAKAPFDAGMRADVADALTVQHAHQFAAVVGGLLWASATLVYARRTAGTCVRCGRGTAARSWTAPEAAARWGRWPVYVAAAIPVIYAATRWIWVAGVPMGLPEDVHADGLADGSLWAGAWLGSFALVGSVLTVGLLRPWGEVFPRWIPVLRGRRVPISLAVGPAVFVAAIVTSAGLGLYRSTFDESSQLRLSTDTWAAIGPELLWPLWGVALAAGTLGYYLRRRGTCGTCGRGAAA